MGTAVPTVARFPAFAIRPKNPDIDPLRVTVTELLLVTFDRPGASIARAFACDFSSLDIDCWRT